MEQNGMQVMDFKPHFAAGDGSRKAFYADRLSARRVTACESVHTSQGQIDEALQVGAADKTSSSLQVGHASSDQSNVGKMTSTLYVQHPLVGDGNLWAVSPANPTRSTNVSSSDIRYPFTAAVSTQQRQSLQSFMVRLGVTEPSSTDNLTSKDIFTVQILPPPNMAAALAAFDIVPMATLATTNTSLVGAPSVSRVASGSSFFIELKVHWRKEDAYAVRAIDRPEAYVNISLALVAPVVAPSA
jgi:hypothetical protein